MIEATARPAGNKQTQNIRAVGPQPALRVHVPVNFLVYELAHGPSGLVHHALLQYQAHIRHQRGRFKGAAAPNSGA